jgi:hypothetical protein
MFTVTFPGLAGEMDNAVHPRGGAPGVALNLKIMLKKVNIQLNLEPGWRTPKPIDREDILELRVGGTHLRGEGVSFGSSIIEESRAGRDMRLKDRKLVVAGFHG